MMNHSFSRSISALYFIYNKNKILVNMSMKNNENGIQNTKSPHSYFQQANPQTITPIGYYQELRTNFKVQHGQIVGGDAALLSNINRYSSALSRMFVDLFGEQALKQQLTQIDSQERGRHDAIDTRIAQCIANEIIRLQQIEEAYVKYQKILERSAKPGSNEEKWKIIVLSYRQKLQKSQQALKQQKKMKALLQKELDARMEEAQRLANMNNIRCQKISEVMTDLEEKVLQTKELSSIISQMEFNMSTIKKDSQKLQQSLLLAQRQKQELTRELHEISQTLRIQREKSILIERRNDQEGLTFEPKILLSEDNETRREILDIKAKYEHQIQQLNDKLRINNAEKKLYFSKMLEYQQMYNSNKENKKNFETIQQQSQTQEGLERVHSNSLYDDLQGDHIPEMAQQSHLSNRESIHQQSENEFQLQFNPQSANNHHINTPREFYEDYSDRQVQKNHYSSNLDASFEQGNSLSNAPSRYMETLQQLTSQLAEAYQRINEMTQKMNALEDQNKRLVTKNPVQKATGKFVGGILNNFFKK